MACLRKKKRKKGVVWYVDYYDSQGKRRWFNTQTSSRKIAEKMKAKIEVDLALGRLDLPQNKRPVTLSKLRDSYLEYSRAEHKKATYELNERFLNNFLDFAGDMPIDRITRKEAEEYKIHRLKSVGKTSVNMEIRHLKAAFSYAVEIGKFIDENPFRSVKQYKITGNNLPQFLSLEDIEKLKVIIKNPDFKNLILFYIYTGCRRGEALSMTWNNIDLKRKIVRITDTKGGPDREVPIKDELLEALKSMEQDGERLFTYNEDYVNRRFKKYLKEAGISGCFTIHSLRHTFASHLVMSGTDLYTVQKLLGHSSVKVTEIYAHLAPDFLALGVSRLPY